MALSIRAVRNPPVCPGLLAVTVIYAISIGGIDVIMNAGGTMSSGSWLEGKVVSSLFLSKKGGEKFLPTCVHFHVAKSTVSPLDILGGPCYNPQEVRTCVPSGLAQSILICRATG